MLSSRLVSVVAPQVRQMSVISAPPRYTLSVAQKVIGAVSITVGMFTVPGWVLCNVKNYKKKE